MRVLGVHVQWLIAVAFLILIGFTAFQGRWVDVLQLTGGFLVGYAIAAYFIKEAGLK